MITREYVLFRVESEVHWVAVIFLAVLPWQVLAMFRRRSMLLEGPLLTLIVGIGCLLFANYWIPVKHATNRSEQLSQLKTLSRATLEYASDHSEALPIANVWMDSISNRVTEADFLLGKYLEPPQQGYHVAMNSDLSKKELSNVESPDQSILYFVSHKSKRNSNDALHSIIEDRRAVSVSGIVKFFPEPTSSKP